MPLHFNSEFSNNKDIFIKQINSDNGRKLDYLFKSNAKKSKSHKKQYKPKENNARRHIVKMPIKEVKILVRFNQRRQAEKQHQCHRPTT